MKLIEEIEVLRRKIDQIDKPYLHSELNSVDLIEGAFWARSVLEIIGKVEFHKYNYTLRRTIRPTDTAPNRPGMHTATAAYTNGSIELKKLLDTIVHFRYFEHDRYRDGNNCLQVQSDLNKKLFQVFFSDFVEALKTFLIPRKLVAVTLCDLLEEKWSDMARGWRGKKDLFGLKNFVWLTGDFLKDEVEIKRKFMQEFFGITDVPTEILRNRNFACLFGPEKLNLVYRDNQKAFTESQSLDPKVLFALIRQFCLDNKDW